MKNKIKAILCLAVLLMLLAACSGNSDTSASAPQEQVTGGVELLSGYPEDILPLYNSVKVESSAFTVREAANWVYGKDIYTVDFYSNASLEEVSDYYRGLMDEIDEEYSAPDSIDGKIGAHPVGVLLQEDGSGSTSVHLILGLDPADYVSENPYFSDYPRDLIEPFGRERFSESTYETRDLSGPEVIYRETYVTNTTEEEFKNFYSEKYSGAENLYEQDDDYGLSYQWDSRGYTCVVSISAYSGGGDQWVTAVVSKKL